MKKHLSLLLSLLIVLVVFSACIKESGGNPPDDADTINELLADEDEEEYSGISFAEEMDGAEIEFNKHPSPEFVGHWIATSDYAVFLYGNLDLDIKGDNTWTGNITDEEVSGTWEPTENGIYMNNDEFSFELAFADSGNLILIEKTEGDDDDIYTVLTKE